MPTKKHKSEDLLFKQESFWDCTSQKEQDMAFEFCEEYKKFLNLNKTEKQVIAESIKKAKQNGFKSVDLDSKLASGKKLIFNNRDKSAILVSIGKEGMQQGSKFLLAHVDSPRLDLKVRPLYEDTGIAYLKPHYYGGIKKYHWPTIPLSMIGTVVLKNGQEIEINIGEKKDDPIFLISDLLPHIDSERMDKPLKKAIDAEELNIIVGSRPVKDKKIKDRVKLAVLDWLNTNYQMSEIDLFSADLRFVPSFPARDVGFDKSMIAGYGQDDRVCTYTALEAFLKSKEDKTKILFLVDKEEIGSVDTTGARSLFLENVLEYILYETNTAISTNDFFRKSKAISADVTAAFDPDYKTSYDPHNSPYLGNGVVIEKYLGWGGKMMSADAEPKFIRHFIDLFNSKKVVWQTGHLGKVDAGGGGTIAVYLANRNVEVIDMGVPLLNMHAPYELASKADIYSAYKGYRVFLEN
ncbi:MAG: aminopeptidase [Candidatus Kuenenbacteria bacterium]